MSEHETELLPWLQGHFGRLAGLAGSGKLAHAYLFGGQQGLGKLAMARHFARYLMCREKQGEGPCGACRDCLLFTAGSHPDLKTLQPEASSEIKIEQVRDVIDFIGKTSRRGGYKVVLVSPAEAMNINSANALLKALEEPTPQTLLVLVSHQPALLVATIRSRCHHIKFNRPSPETVTPWLESKNIRAPAAELLRMAGGVPLRALEFADENAVHDRTVLHTVLEKLLRGDTGITEAAAECEGFGVEENIEAMLLCTADILAYSQSRAGGSEARLHDHDLESLAAFFTDRTKLKKLHVFYQDLLAARRAVNSTSNPNALLVLESLFYNLAATVR